MKKLRHKKKAMTIVEMAIAIGIMSIVIVLIFSFINTVQKRRRNIEIRQELQFDCTFITENLTKEALESKGIASITPQSRNTEKIEFRSKNNSENVILTLKDKKLKIEKKSEEGEGKELSKNIKSMEILNYIESGAHKTNISKMNSINLKFELEKSGVEYSCTTELYFRNFK